MLPCVICQQPGTTTLEHDPTDSEYITIPHFGIYLCENCWTNSPRGFYHTILRDGCPCGIDGNLHDFGQTILCHVYFEILGNRYVDASQSVLERTD